MPFFQPKIEVQDFEEDNAREACNLQVKTESNLVSFSGIIPKEEGKVKGEREIEIDFLGKSDYFFRYDEVMLH